jgi:hypothetical protein
VPGAVEVGAGELRVEGPGDGVVVLLEGEDLGGELIEVLGVVGGEELALDDGNPGRISGGDCA